jgi:hypothetical protein
MKTRVETFEDMQKIIRFVCNGSIPFAYELDLSEVGTPLSGTHIVRIIEKSTGSVIVVKLSENEASIILNNSDPIDYLVRWLDTFQQRHEHGGEETMSETIVRGISQKPVFDDTYFITGNSYRLVIKKLSDNYVYNNTAHDCLILKYNAFKNVMTVMFVNDDCNYTYLDLSIEQYISGKFQLKPLTIDYKKMMMGNK